MKAATLALAALFGTAVSGSLHNRHAHQKFHELIGRRDEAPPIDNATCGCTTYVTTIYGQAVLGQPTTTTTLTSSTTETLTTTAAAGPSPLVTVCPTPGVYTFPATTITVTEETIVCGATTTEIGSGEQTYGGVTTVVETETTVVCPYATVSPVGSTVTTTIETTTTVCPAAGTYTIAPITTSVPASTVEVYPTPQTFAPGTYTQPATTITVTTTDFVYICPFTSATPAAPAPAGSSAVTPPPAESAAPAPESSSPPASSPPIGSGGDKWCMTYSPYTAAGGCKDAGSVAADISVIAAKGFGSVRIYSTDCSGLETVGAAARDHGLKLVLGIFIKEDGIGGSRSQLTDIVSWAQFDLVELVVVGNESIFNKHCSASDLAAYISEVKATLQGAGYSGPCTTTEPLDVLQEVGSQLCGAIDVIGANCHPFFNSGVSASQAGSFLAGQIDLVGQTCSGKDVYILETGWPHGGEPNGAAIPSPEEQAIAIQGIQESCKNVAFFSFEDDLWKLPGNFGVEQSWGCSDQFSG